MKFSARRAGIIARREYLTTIRRKAFVFSLVATPALVFASTFISSKVSSDDARAHQHLGRVVAIVDSSGLYDRAQREFAYVPDDAATPATRRATLRAGADGDQALQVTPPAEAAPSRGVPVIVRPFASQTEALDSLSAGTVNTVLVVAPDFLATGRVRRYEKDTRVFTNSGDDRPLRVWLTRNLIAGAVDSARIERVLRLGRTIDLYTQDRAGAWALKDDARELTGFLLPFVLGMLLSMSIVAGGQYLLQGVAEEKETRILESLLCTVTPDDLMVGKLIGLGGAGLTLVAVWVAVGLIALSTSFAFLHVDLAPGLLALGVAYFAFGYLFYASLMTGIGAITNNLREANQMAVLFTLMNFFPFYVLVSILNSPNSPIAVGMSMFPPTAATTMLMRVAAGNMGGAVIPTWQIALSLGLLIVTSVVTMRLSSRVFRIGLLMYGKTPNLPEILRIVRQG